MAPRPLSPQARAFADACHTNAPDELLKAMAERRADRADCATWGITPTEWRVAIRTALDERLLRDHLARVRGGQATRGLTSPAKRRAARENGKRGGRPKGS